MRRTTPVVRRLLVIVAVLIALAGGIALGSGPLQKDQETRHVSAPTASASPDAADRFAAAVGPVLVAHRLTGRSVAVVALPGASPDDVTALRTLVAQAGASVTVTLRLPAKAAAGHERSLVDALTAQQAAQVKLPGTLGPYVRLGALLARAIGTTAVRSPYDAAAASVVTGLGTAGLASTDARPTARAGLVLVVAGSATSATVGEQLVAGIARGARVELIGPDSGLLRAVRANATLAHAVGTADPSDQPAGRAAAVLALVPLAAGHPGSYGAHGTSFLPAG